VVLNVVEVPYKCPIAPLEFVFMADWFFTVSGVRDKVEIEFVTPLDNVFTKPVAAKALAQVAVQKKIKVTPYFDLAQVNAKEKTIESHKGQTIGYDLLVAIPPNMGDHVLIDSEVSDPIGFVATNNATLQAEKFDRVYVIGDTTNVPTSKAGSVAHYMAYTLYSPEQLQQIGDGLVRLTGVLHKLVAPEALDLLDKAADLPASADVAGAKPVGLFRLIGALSDPKLKAGMGVALELTRGLAALREP